MAFGGSILSGYLIYIGLANNLERRHFRLKLKNTWQSGKVEYLKKAELSHTEKLLYEARYPLGLTAVRYQLLLLFLIYMLFLNYTFISYLMKGYVQWTPILIGSALILILNPGLRYSPIRFLLNKLIDYRKAKRNAELFSLYDMIVSEIEMMRTTRVNIYSLLKAMLPYFKELNPLLTKMLSDWTSSTVGPYKAVENFAAEIGTSEAKSLATVLKSFDENSRETLLMSLRGMEEMFVTSQIENNRRKHKLFIDLVSLPVKASNFLILLNFIIVIVMMVMVIMGNSKLNL